MRMLLADWEFDVNIELTMELSADQASDHCMCGYCRNFYASIDSVCPTARRFLARFGLDIEGPDELCPIEPTIYEASYIVQGSILRAGTVPLRIDNIPLQILTADAADMATEHPAPYFVLRMGLIELPWVLDEPMDEVLSPTNEESYLKRIEEKLLQYAANEFNS